MHYQNVRYKFVFVQNEVGAQLEDGGDVACNWLCIKPLALPGMTFTSETSMPITFTQLINDYERRLGSQAQTIADSPKPSTHTAKNRVSMLKTTLRLLQVDPDIPVEVVFSTSALEGALAAITLADGPKQQRKADLRSNLRWWSTFYLTEIPQPTPEKAVADTKQAKLGQCLRRAIREAQITQREVSVRAEIPLVTLEKWVRGASLPDFRSLEALRRLEAVLALPPLSLNSSLRKRIYGKCETKGTRYGEELKQKRELRYRFKPSEITAEFRKAWQDLVTHQACMSPILKRSALSHWNFKPLTTAEKAPFWFESYLGQRCSSASVAWNSITGYLAFLTLPSEKGGLAIPRHQAQTLAWFAVPHAIEAYLVWHKGRSGLANNGLRNFASYAAAMCRRETGYIRQQPNLKKHIPDVTVGDWNESCDRVVTIAQKTTQTAHSHSRDPFEGLGYYLDFEDPAEPILNAIRHLQSSAAVVCRGSTEYAIVIRDAAILALVLLAPLRLGTLKYLRVGENREVFINGYGLNLRIPEPMLKNGSKRGPLKAEFQGELLTCIATYLDGARPILAQSTETDLLFFSSRAPTQPWGGLSVRISEITATYCEGNAIPLHSLRHLVATRHLRQNPGDYKGAAYLLHDSIEMVMKTYIKSNDGTTVRHGGSFKL